MTDPTTGDGSRVRPEWTWRDRERAARIRGVYLDPDLQPAGTPEVHSTVYEADVLLVAPPDPGDAQPIDQQTTIGRLSTFAQRWGWVVSEQALEDPRPSPPSDQGAAPPPAPLPTAAQTVRARITLAPDADPSRPLQRPDAWRLLREARREARRLQPDQPDGSAQPQPDQPDGSAQPQPIAVPGIERVSLNHILTVDPIGVNPFKANPFKANPFKANPFKANPAGIDGYGSPGFGGRQPVYWGGPQLPRPDVAEGTRRPVVAILDTGCGKHPWFGNDALIEQSELGGEAPVGKDALERRVLIDPEREYKGPLGIVHHASNPEVHPSLADPLDGIIDEAAGHGTFIAGLVLQACPQARVLPVRVADGQGIILENELIAALGQIVDLLEKGKATIDVLNLSFSYYHESPERAAFDSELYSMLTLIRAHGCIVVCSAGNDATDRPASPAALYAYPGSDFGVTEENEAERAKKLKKPDLAPHVVVGALNPSGKSVALFSNVGDWVTTYARGVSVVSTIPNFEGGAQADLRHDAYGRRRETLDIDDFEAGFAVWSGTSFAAPLVAGRIAAALAPKLPKQAAAERAPALNLAETVNSVIDAFDGEDRSIEKT